VPDHCWDKFEWDDENKKNEMCSICAITELSQKKRRSVFSTIMNSPSTSVDSMMFTFWMVEPIAEEDCVSFFRTKATGLLASSRVGI
jgi:hypothetical protein